MAPQQKNTTPNNASVSLVSNLWKNWVQLEPSRRNQVASQLGTLGHLLTIAANVQNFAQRSEQSQNSNPSSNQTSSTSRTSQVQDDEDIIEVDFEEVKK